MLEGIDIILEIKSVDNPIINDIEKAFYDLACKGKLKQGNGVFEYGEFQIHI